MTEDAFASALRDLLTTDPGTAERAVRLGAVESRQVARAAVRFRTSTERGMAALSGALFLMRDGELGGRLPAGADTEYALRSGARSAASAGDEGRAHALYDLLLGAVPVTEQAEIQEHVQAIEQWTRDVSGDAGTVENAGAAERIAVRRRLLEPTVAARDAAVIATTEWIRRAVALRDAFRATRVQPTREEGSEAWRALEVGPLVLASIDLRNGNAREAAASLDRAGARELMASERPQFLEALDAAAQAPTSAHCADLLAQLSSLATRDENRGEDDSDDDHALFGAATFTVASECYRLDASVPQVAFTLVVAMGELGMPEAAPAVLSAAVRAHPDPEIVSEALALSLAAMAGEEQSGDIGSARRVFDAAQPLLVVADGKALAGRVRPSAARLRAAMGEMEVREGNLDRARALLEASASEEVEGTVLLSLARIERRDGRVDEAQSHLRDALLAEDALHDPSLRGEILLLASDIAREKGDVAGARTPLTDALKDLVQSRSVRDGDARARVERVLSRVLDRFGALQPAERALERAYAAAPGNRSQAAQTLELLVGRAFVQGDLTAARDGVRRAIGADLETDDLVYFALWVRLLERELHTPSDGTPDRVFASVADDSRWVAVLARFGEGKLKADELVARAATPIQRYEALFYAAIDRRAAGDKTGGDELLREVVAGTGVELSEVGLAREILSPSPAQVGGLPEDVAVP